MFEDGTLDFIVVVLGRVIGNVGFPGKTESLFGLVKDVYSMKMRSVRFDTLLSMCS